MKATKANRTADVSLRYRMADPSRVNLLVSAGSPADKAELLHFIKILAEKGVKIYATGGTSAYLDEHGVKNTKLNKVSDKEEPNIKTFLDDEIIHGVISIPTGDTVHDNDSDLRYISRRAEELEIPLYVTMKDARDAFGEMVKALTGETFVYKIRNPDRPWDLMTKFVANVNASGGWAMAHSHLDKANVITDENLRLANAAMEHKWKLFDVLKAGPAYSPEGIFERMCLSVEEAINRRVRTIVSFIDVDPVVGLKCMQAAHRVREHYQGKIKMLFATQPLHGVIEPAAWEVYQAGCEMADIIGGLPSKDKLQGEEHLNRIMRVALKMDKDVHVHVDQENNPDQNETEQLALKTIEHGLQGKVWAVHSISVAAKPERDQNRIIKKMKEAGVGVVICPSAAISMQQLPEHIGPMHNSIAPFRKLLAAGIRMMVGPDNIRDIFQPFVDGDMVVEMRLLMEAARFYDHEVLAGIACAEGII